MYIYTLLRSAKGTITTLTQTLLKLDKVELCPFMSSFNFRLKIQYTEEIN